jgi:hypothetical protein
MHFTKNLFGEGLSAGLSLFTMLVIRDRTKRGKRYRRGDVQDIRPDLCSGCFNPFDDPLGELLDMPVGRVEDYCDDWFGPAMSQSSNRSAYMMIWFWLSMLICDSVVRYSMLEKLVGVVSVISTAFSLPSRPFNQLDTLSLCFSDKRVTINHLKECV